MRNLLGWLETRLAQNSLNYLEIVYTTFKYIRPSRASVATNANNNDKTTTGTTGTTTTTTATTTTTTTTTTTATTTITTTTTNNNDNTNATITVTIAVCLTAADYVTLDLIICILKHIHIGDNGAISFYINHLCCRSFIHSLIHVISSFLVLVIS